MLILCEPVSSLLANMASCVCSSYGCICDNTCENVFVHVLYPVYVHDVLMLTAACILPIEMCSVPVRYNI
jgi:hypothetical protein